MNNKNMSIELNEKYIKDLTILKLKRNYGVIEREEFRSELINLGINNGISDYAEMLTFIAFTRIGMRALIELTVTKNGDLKDNIRDVMNYLDINFFEWRKNPFLKLKNVPRKKYWIAYTMYKYGFQQLFIKIYSKPIEKGNKLLII